MPGRIQVSASRLLSEVCLGTVWVLAFFFVSFVKCQVHELIEKETCPQRCQLCTLDAPRTLLVSFGLS